MPFLISDLQSTQNVGFDDLVGALLYDVADPHKFASPKELVEQVLGVATRLCNAPIDVKDGAAFDARMLITAHMGE